MSDDMSIPSPTYRVPRHRRGMDPLTRRLAVIACGLGVTMIVVVGGWSMLNHHAGTIPVVQAESGPIKVKPQILAGCRSPAAMTIFFLEMATRRTASSRRLRSLRILWRCVRLRRQFQLRLHPCPRRRRRLLSPQPR